MFEPAAVDVRATSGLIGVSVLIHPSMTPPEAMQAASDRRKRVLHGGQTRRTRSKQIPDRAIPLIHAARRSGDCPARRGVSADHLCRWRHE